MQLSGKKIVILVDNIYQEMEVWYPLYRLREAGAEVVTVGATAGATYTSKLGYPVHCDKSYDEVSASQFDGVVVPGGYAPDHIRRHAKANQLVHDFDAQGKLVAAWRVGFVPFAESSCGAPIRRLSERSLREGPVLRRRSTSCVRGHASVELHIGCWERFRRIE